VKVLIHSNGPHVPSGYGKQARLAGRALRDLGHEVAFSCFSGLGGSPIRWEGYTMFPGGMLEFGVDTLIPHAHTFGAELIITIMDTYKLFPIAAELAETGIMTAPFMAIDCTAENGGPSIADQMTLATMHGCQPVAVSRFGQERLEAIGFHGSPYVPHCFDGAVFVPPADRNALREENGTAGDFMIGICAANSDLMRKGWQEQFAAFARFARRHKNAKLSVFTVYNRSRGLNLPEMASDMGIPGDRIVWMPVYEQVCGLLPDEFMAAYYGSIDVLSNCAYAEGFGVPLIEAQACGTPVVATDASAMTELAMPAGWLVKGSRYWNPVLRAWWTRPDEDLIVKAWERAWAQGDAMPERRHRARAAAKDYACDTVRDTWWAPFMKQMEDAL
jgi:glycosyltransferase involved in cell wall biosynthesis